MTRSEYHELYIKNLQDICNQLEFCEYQTKDNLHDLKMNDKFIQLKRIAELDKSLGRCPRCNTYNIRIKPAYQFEGNNIDSEFVCNICDLAFSTPIQEGI